MFAQSLIILFRYSFNLSSFSETYRLQTHHCNQHGKQIVGSVWVFCLLKSIKVFCNFVYMKAVCVLKKTACTKYCMFYVE